jgi:hypothetical protein
MLTRKEKLNKLIKRIKQNLTKFKGEKTIVFIAGEQRSGTNFLTDVINQSSQVETFLENDDEAFLNYVLKDITCINKLIQNSSAKIILFKSICDSQKARFFLDQYENSRVIWAFRRYDDVINSSIRRFTEHRKYLDYMLNDRNSAGWRVENVTAEDLELVRHYFDLGVDDYSSRALIWYLRNKLYYQLSLDTINRVYLTKYEALVGDPKLEFDKVFKFLDMDVVRHVEKLAFSSSVGKNSQSDINPEIRELCETLYQRLLKQHSN